MSEKELITNILNITIARAKSADYNWSWGWSWHHHPESSYCQTANILPLPEISVVKCVELLGVGTFLFKRKTNPKWLDVQI